MKVKHKLFLSLAFFFGVIICSVITGSYYLLRLATDSAAILKDNNRTLSYMRNIEEAVDQVQFLALDGDIDTAENSQYFQTIEENIHLQQNNITVPGEQPISDKLETHLMKLQRLMNSSDSISDEQYQNGIIPTIREIKDLTSSIYLINEKTMLDKNEQANDTAEKAVLYMGIFGGASVLIGCILLFWLPAYISRPLITFNQAISEVASGNYKVVIPSDSKDEYGELAESFNKMAAKLDEYEHSNLAKLLKEQKRLNAVINQLDEVVLGLDESKKVIFANKHCLRLLNLEKHQMIGQYAPDIATNNQLMNNLIKGLMVGFYPDEKKSEKPLLKIVENNREKLFSKNVVEVIERPTGEDRQILMGHVVILTDVTEFAEKDKAKTHFIATLSHELKTPVSAIQMSTKLLRNKKSGALSENQEELLATIEDNNDRINRMINEILDVSKIESGTIDIHLDEENAEELIDQAVEGVKVFLEEKNLKINKVITGVHSLIKVDAHKTVWILNNFLTNAIRYAPAGSVIAVKAEMDEHRVKIAVVDQGPGIAPENQKKIFQKFTRLLNTENAGTGLGLAISKEFIEAMGGSIGVHSREGEGATFWITCLPV